MNPHRERLLLYAKSIPFNSHTFMKQPQTHTPVSTQEKKMMDYLYNSNRNLSYFKFKIQCNIYTIQSKHRRRRRYIHGLL